jgi:hypothetical protein
VATNPVTIDSGWFNAVSIQVRFQATDEATAAPPQSLSAGAKAGIGVGVALGAILILLGLGAWIFWRKRRLVRDGTQLERPGDSSIPDQHLYPMFKAELEDTQKNLDNRPDLASSAGGTYNNKPIELDTTSPPRAGAQEVESRPLAELG